MSTTHSAGRRSATTSPSQISVANDIAKKLGVVLFQSAKDLFTDSGPQWAAAISYYALLSAFPLFLCIGAVAASFVDPDWAVKHVTNLLGEFVPQGGNRVQEIVQGAINARGRVGLISFVTLLWTGTRIFSVLIRALNVAFDAKRKHGFVLRFLIEIVMLITIGVVFVLALGSNLLIRAAWDALGVLPSGQDVAFQALLAIVQGLFLLLAFFQIYRFIPRDPQRWPTALIGASVATLLFLLARPIFLFYVHRFGHYNLIYGSLASAIILMFWIWIVGLITLYGGEVAAHAKAMLVEGRSAKEVERQHKQHSFG